MAMHATATVGRRPALLPGTALPAPGAVPRVRIYRPAPSATQSGRARRVWVLEFDRPTPPTLDPLMGWTGGGDPLASVQLSFPDRESAIAFARKNGWTIEGAGDTIGGAECVADPGRTAIGAHAENDQPSAGREAAAREAEG